MVTALAVGVLAAAEKVKVSLMTTSPVPFDASVRFAFDVADDIDSIFVKFCPRSIVIVSGSDPAVLIFAPPTNCKICHVSTVIAVESSPATFNVNELDDVST